MENFSSVDADVAAKVSRADLKTFKACWRRVDPNASGWAPSSSLLAIMQHLPSPLGFRGANPKPGLTEQLRIHASLGLPERNGRIHFTETLIALTYRVCGAELDSQSPALQRLRKQANAVPGAAELRRRSITVQSAHTALLATLVQSRWRGYIQRKAQLREVGGELRLQGGRTRFAHGVRIDVPATAGGLLGQYGDVREPAPPPMPPNNVYMPRAMTRIEASGIGARESSELDRGDESGVDLWCRLPPREAAPNATNGSGDQSLTLPLALRRQNSMLRSCLRR